MFRSFKDTDGEHNIYLRSGNITVIVNSGATELIKITNGSVYLNYQDNLSVNFNIEIVLEEEKIVEIKQGYISKYNGKKYQYLVVRILSALLKVITLKHNEDFYCLNC